MQPTGSWLACSSHRSPHVYEVCRVSCISVTTKAYRSPRLRASTTSDPSQSRCWYAASARSAPPGGTNCARLRLQHSIADGHGQGNELSTRIGGLETELNARIDGLRTERSTRIDSQGNELKAYIESGLRSTMRTLFFGIGSLIVAMTSILLVAT
jgi:hypothetical protein